MFKRYRLHLRFRSYLVQKLYYSFNQKVAHLHRKQTWSGFDPSKRALDYYQMIDMKSWIEVAYTSVYPIKFNYSHKVLLYKILHWDDIYSWFRTGSVLMIKQQQTERPGVHGKYNKVDSPLVKKESSTKRLPFGQFSDSYPRLTVFWWKRSQARG